MTEYTCYVCIIAHTLNTFGVLQIPQFGKNEKKNPNDNTLGQAVGLLGDVVKAFNGAEPPKPKQN